MRRRPREIHLHFHRCPTVLGQRLARRHPILARAKLHEASGREEHSSRCPKAHKATVRWHFLARVARVHLTIAVLRHKVDQLLTQNTAELIRYALRGIEQIFREGYHYKKAGVIVTALVPAHQVQTHLFDQYDRERSQRLMAALDAINTPWGTGTVRYGVVGVRPRWRMRCVHRSLQYTTQWQELVMVRCAG